MFSRKVKRVAAVLLAVVVLIFVGVFGIILGYNYVISQNDRFDELTTSDLKIDRDTPDSVMIVIDRGDQAPEIAQKLFDSGLIDHPFMFTVLSKFNGFDGGYLAGTHFLVHDLSYDQMMYLLCQQPGFIQITFPEGMTYMDIKQKLRKEGLEYSEEKLDACMNDPKLFVDYPFVAFIQASEERDYLLNGYLFPDTYYFDMNVSEEQIIHTFLRNMERKLRTEYYERADYLDMTMDEIIALASLIQAESGQLSDMFRISAVFHNRLNSSDASFHYLQSCASTNYLRQQDGLDRVWAATTADRQRDSLYNTYRYPGLPPGPVCMPGVDAIQAALYPEPNEPAMFFVATGDGGTAFARTYAEHERNIEKYSEAWGA